MLDLASRLLTPPAVDGVIAPTLDDVLVQGRFEIISIGFVIALWSGSRALNVVVDTITIMYGLAGQRSILRTRALSFALYVVFLLAAVDPAAPGAGRPGSGRPGPAGPAGVIGHLYWPVVLVGSVCVLATLYHLAVPVRTRWRADLPGAALTLLLWLGGSALLRLVLGLSIGTTSIYGPLAAPIAVLLWLYLYQSALLIGAAFNASLDAVSRLSGIDHQRPISWPPRQWHLPRLGTSATPRPDAAASQ